jgi:hypothetical protein
LVLDDSLNNNHSYQDANDQTVLTWSSTTDFTINGTSLRRTNSAFDWEHHRAYQYEFDLTPTNIQALQVLGGLSSTNVFDVYQTVPSLAVSVDTGAGNDTVNAGVFRVNLGSPLTVTGHGASATLNVNDTYGGTAAILQAYTVAADQVQAGAATVYYRGFTNLNLNTSQANDSVTVQGTPAGMSLTIAKNGPGNDKVQADLDTLKGPLTVSGSNGNGQLLLSNSNSTLGHNIDITANTVTRDGGAPITYSGIATLQVTGSIQADNTFAVEGTAPGVSTALNGGYRNNSFLITPNSQNLDAIQGPLSIGGIIISPNFVNQVAIHDEQAPGAPAYTVTAQMWVTIPLATVLKRSGAAPITMARGETPIDLWTAERGGTVSVQALPPKTVLNIHGWTDDAIDVSSLPAVQGTVNVSQEVPSVTINASALGVSAVAVDGNWLDGAGPLALQLMPGQHYIYAQGVYTYFTVNADYTIDYDASLNGALAGRGTMTLSLLGRAVALDASALGVSAVAIDGTWLDGAGPLALRLMPGQHYVYAQGVYTYFTVNADGTLDYDASLDGALSGRGTAILSMQGRTLTLDISALGVSTAAIDGVWVNLAGPTALQLMPGQHYIYAQGVYTYFTVNADGTLDYDASLDGALTGRSTTALSLIGRMVTVDVSALGLSTADIDGGWVNLSGPTALQFMPGQHWVYAQGVYTYFTVDADGSIDYDASLEGALSGRGTTSLTLLGRAVTLDASALGATSLELDNGSIYDASAPLNVQLMPGQHWIYAGGVYTYFTVNADGTLDYDASLDGALSGRGTTALTLLGRTVTLDLSALGAPVLELDNGSIYDASAPLNVQLMPGKHWVYAQGVYTYFTVNADGTLDYDASLDSALSGRGTTTLTFLAP